MHFESLTLRTFRSSKSKIIEKSWRIFSSFWKLLVGITFDICGTTFLDKVSALEDPLPNLLVLGTNKFWSQRSKFNKSKDFSILKWDTSDFRGLLELYRGTYCGHNRRSLIYRPSECMWFMFVSLWPNKRRVNCEINENLRSWDTSLLFSNCWQTSTKYLHRCVI